MIIVITSIRSKLYQARLIYSLIVSQIKIKIETYKNSELPEELINIKAVKPGSRNLFK